MRTPVVLRVLLCLVAMMLLWQSALADDSYKPYLHEASVPEHPDVVLYGKYQTNLYPGAATYALAVDVPKGTNGLQPTIVITYNSQGVLGRPKIVGAGWLVTQNYVMRDINSTVDTADDFFVLVLDGTPYKIIRTTDGTYHTEVDYNFRVQKLADAPNDKDEYWLVTKKDGTTYRLGYLQSSEMTSNTGKDFALQWNLDLVTDTHGNTITYTYEESPHPDDVGATYLRRIEYNQDKSRVVEFSYESSLRPDRRRSYEQTNVVEESRRLTDISVIANDELVRRYHINYSALGPALTTISSLALFGSDNVSIAFTSAFNYSLSTPWYQNLTGTGQWVPPILFSNDSHVDFGARLVDLNNDGFIDIIVRKNLGENTAYINNKSTGWTVNSSWASPVTIVGSTSVDVGVRFADVNDDGFMDILSSYSGTRKVYLNTKRGWNLSTIDIPTDFVDGSDNDQGIQIIDINGDGRVDLLKAITGSAQKVWLNTGNGWSLDSSWTIPTYLMYGSADYGTRIIDVNGDGLPDILHGRSANRTAWLNTGTGWSANTTWAPPYDFVTSAYVDTGARFADVNGDGLVDVLVGFVNASSTTSLAYLNTGNGWVFNSSWVLPEAFTKDGFNIGRRLADINGDGFADLIVSHQRTSLQYSHLKNATTPYLLQSIRNEYGGLTTVGYVPSTHFDNNDENGTSELGFCIYVVDNTTVTNGLTNADNGAFAVLSATNYSYAQGKYNYAKNEFRGFGITTETTPTSIVTHRFYQDDPRQGKEWQTELSDLQGNPYAKSINEYNSTMYAGIYNVSLLYTTNFQYDGLATDPLVTNTSYEYDGYGNIVTLHDWGDVSAEGDEKQVDYTYAYNHDDWIMDKAATVIVTDADNNRMKETRYYYDGLGLQGIAEKGELTKVFRWNNHGNDSITSMSYDNYGNKISETDSLGRITRYSYDDSHTYVVSVTNPLGRISRASYDLGTDNQEWVEKSGIRTSYSYDVFGRKTKDILPYDTEGAPTKTIIYDFDGVAPERVIVSAKSTADNTEDTSFYYDGLANLVQIKTAAADNQDTVKNIIYDSSSRVGAEQTPFITAATAGLTNISPTAGITNYTYDVLDRVIRVRNPDGTTKNTTYDHYDVTDYDENGNRHTYVLDGRGRIGEVHEYNTNHVGAPEEYVTGYEYNILDNLLKITDTVGNEFSFTYDSLGRKTAIDDPDLGSWSYNYDAEGNLVSQQDAVGNTVNITYDGLNRVVSKDYCQDDTRQSITFLYDQDYDGTLTNVTFGDSSYRYEYDDRLRPILLVQGFAGTALETTFIYDTQGRILEKSRAGHEREYLLDKQGRISTIPGIVSNVSYNALGVMTNKTYANGLMTSFVYDALTNRLASIVVPGVQNLTYTYDHVGNIMTITDAVNSRQHLLTYDNLDRLIEATIGDDRYAYRYSATGNMLTMTKNGAAKQMIYDGGQAHAPSMIVDGAAGLDIDIPHDLDTDSKNKVFETYLYNGQETPTQSNLNMNFGDGTDATAMNLSVNDTVLVFVGHNYSNGGAYTVNFTASWDGMLDSRNVKTRFGTRADDLALLLATGLDDRTLEFDIHNDITETVTNVSWDCTNGAQSTSIYNLAGNQSLTGQAGNYTTPGERTVTCTARSNDGSENKTVTFTIRGVEIENYDVLITNVSRSIIGYDIVNYFRPAQVNLTMTGDNISSFQPLSLDAEERVLVFVETNYSKDGLKSFNINVEAENYSTGYTENTIIAGVSIDEFTRTANDTILLFIVRNHWYNGSVNWSLSEPSVSNVTVLDTNKSVLVFVATDNLSQGIVKPTITARRDTYTEQRSDRFEYRPLDIVSLLTLSEGPSAVTELSIGNSLDVPQLFSWQIDTGAENISSITPANASSGTTFVYVASDYPSIGVYRTVAIINSTAYNDTARGVIVT